MNTRMTREELAAAISELGIRNNFLDSLNVQQGIVYPTLTEKQTEVAQRILTETREMLSILSETKHPKAIDLQLWWNDKGFFSPKQCAFIRTMAMFK